MSKAQDEIEGELVARAREGDEAAFGALCGRYEDVLRRRVERRLSPSVRRRVAVSDVLQDAHIEAHRQIADFEDRGPGSFGHWLGKIVDFKAKQMVRHHAGTAKRNVQAEVTRAARGTLGAIRGRNPSPSQVAMGSEQREAATVAVARLPQNYREVIHLIHGEGLTTAETAGRLGRSRDSVKGLYSRALARLARELNLDRETE